MALVQRRALQHVRIDGGALSMLVMSRRWYALYKQSRDLVTEAGALRHSCRAKASAKYVPAHMRISAKTSAWRREAVTSASAPKYRHGMSGSMVASCSGAAMAAA